MMDVAMAIYKRTDNLSESEPMLLNNGHTFILVEFCIIGFINHIAKG